MIAVFRRRDAAAPASKRPVLDLSGPRLRRAMEDLVESAQGTGGVERYVTALALKSSLFAELLGKGHLDRLEEREFLDMAAFITPVRRRIGAWLSTNGFAPMHLRIRRLFDGWSDTSDADRRLADFCAAFPSDREHRWVRDLGAELLHFTAPERYPLMTRWVWDARVGTGVLREIWHAIEVDTADIGAADDFATFVTLTEEIEGFLADQGVFRDLRFYADLLMAHIYSGYINDRGGQYLRADFTVQADPMMHTRRMLGLDAVDTETGRTRLRLVDGAVHVLGGDSALPRPEGTDAHP